MPNKKKKIAVLGGGVGALTTAFEITNQPGWQDDYELTVYQTGWRLGGKGASGRQRSDHDRIEEHGLHMFLGFYENAFRVMQGAYRELGRNPDEPLATWDEAFKPHSYFVLEEEVDGAMIPWEFDFPTNKDVPGTGGELPSAWAYVQDLIGWMKYLFERNDLGPGEIELGPDETFESLRVARTKVDDVGSMQPEHEHWSPWSAFKRLLIGEVNRLTAKLFLHLAHEHAQSMPKDASLHHERDHRLLLWLLRGFEDWLRRHIEETGKKQDTEARRLLILIDLGVAIVTGMIEDDLITPPHNWFKIDDLVFEDWLRKHGAAEESVTSPPILLLREFVFATYDGVGAGTELYYTLRLVLTYKGAFGWKMQAGMGDTVFTPFYEVLKRRGVKFEFFHRVDALELSADKKNIERIRIGRQIGVKGGGSYDPLWNVKGLPCWPARPNFDQLDGGEKLEQSGDDLEDFWTRWKDTLPELVLERGKHFDEVVLGISIAAFPAICKQLIDDADNPKFKAMVDGVKTTQTQALQLWFRPDLAGLGWKLPSPILGTNWEPFDTWADMTHLIPRESWPEGSVGQISYMCSQLQDDEPVPPASDHDYPARQKARVLGNAVRWLDSRIADIWPAATTTDDPCGLNYWFLVDPKDRPGEQRLQAQYWRAVTSPSERYVQSVAGSVGARLRAGDSGYDNLVLAGDYCLTSISAGCVEAAIMSGLEAAQAITGVKSEIVGNWLEESDQTELPPPATHGAGCGPKYIEFDANSPPLAPYAAKDVTMYSYVLPADYDALQAVCDRYLNLGPTVYKPFGPFLSFVSATMTHMAPKAPAAWLSEKDFGFWMPVMAGHMDGDLYIPERVAMFIPYLWVDGYFPCIAGREVFGYPKGVGDLTMPAKPTDDAAVSIDALVASEYGGDGPASEWKVQPLLRGARTGGGAIGELEDIWNNTEHFVEGLVEMVRDAFKDHAFPVPTWSLVKAMFDDLRHLTVPMVFLKQFRDVANGEVPCYQALVESPNKVTSGPIRGGWLPGDWELDIKQYASCKIIDNLGLYADGGVVKPAFHFWVNFNFAAEPGQVVWRGV